jgi:hypothetical protein
MSPHLQAIVLVTHHHRMARHQIFENFTPIDALLAGLITYGPG